MIRVEGQSFIRKILTIAVLFTVICGIFHISLDIDLHAEGSSEFNLSLKSPSLENNILSAGPHCPLEAPNSNSGSSSHCCHHFAPFMLPYSLSYSYIFENQATFMFLQKIPERSTPPLERPPIV